MENRTTQFKSLSSGLLVPEYFKKRYSERPRVTFILTKIEIGGQRNEIINEQIGLT